MNLLNSSDLMASLLTEIATTKCNSQSAAVARYWCSALRCSVLIASPTDNTACLASPRQCLHLIMKDKISISMASVVIKCFLYSIGSRLDTTLIALTVYI